MPKIQDLDVKNKKVLVRVDFNVPLLGKKITDDTRIIASIPTIEYILDHGGSAILMSHLGRPKGPSDDLSLKPVAEILSGFLGIPVLFAQDATGPDAKKKAAALKPGEVLLLENLRFYEGEKKPESDPSFAKTLASFGDCYINDAFGTAHRADASTYTLPHLFPGKSAAGFLMQEEMEHLSQLLNQPEHPFYAIIGGAKISSKIGVLKSLVDKVDGLLIAGAMAHTFFKAKGWPIGASLYEEDYVQTAREILDLYEKKGVPLLLPVDVVAVQKVAEGEEAKVFGQIPEGWIGVDIGPSTIALYSDFLSKAKTIFWNGPAGVFEIPQFAKGTETLARTIGQLGVIAVVGGGDSVAAVKKLGLESGFTHLSTGGGASLELIEKGSLPGVEALYTEMP